MTKVAVLGAGSWGTALSIVLADNGHEVFLWTHRKEQADEINQTRRNEKYLDVSIPETIVSTNDIKKALHDCSYILLVVPTKAIREVCQVIKPYITENMTIIHATKGIEPSSFKRVSEMIFEELPSYKYENITVLSGPSHAEEVAKRDPTTVTVSAINFKKAKAVQDLFINKNFRVYTSDDIIGIELGGSLKNIIALSTGISDGLGYGDNAKAALITRGLAEI
ncbi:MAG TPA: NAD(P)H-dependent glycerol-3-phosphate dehydrogenase, partial [Bacillota bacterium]|nr:NAD(P)H-dependent glycerol-3-phosphate dehydrogenase [Bacillota bacterium]